MDSAALQIIFQAFGTALTAALREYLASPAGKKFKAEVIEIGKEELKAALPHLLGAPAQPEPSRSLDSIDAGHALGNTGQAQ